MKYLAQVKKYGSKLAAGGGLAIASAGAFAADYSADITAAQTAATTNVGAVATAVIAVSALTFGLVAVVLWLRK